MLCTVGQRVRPQGESGSRRLRTHPAQGLHHCRRLRRDGRRRRGAASRADLAASTPSRSRRVPSRREIQAGDRRSKNLAHAPCLSTAANRAWSMTSASRRTPDLRGMGTTIVAACVRHERACPRSLHVGDSRAYLAGPAPDAAADDGSLARAGAGRERSGAAGAGHTVTRGGT